MVLRFIIISLGVIFLAGCSRTSTPAPISQPSPTSATDNATALIKVTFPRRNQLVQSPLKITGEARGSYFFEGSFPIKLLDENNNLIGQTVTHAQGEWMTENFVPFTATLTFTPVLPNGFANLIFQKDNPSGLPANDQSFTVPVRY